MVHCRRPRNNRNHRKPPEERPWGTSSPKFRRSFYAIAFHPVFRHGCRPSAKHAQRSRFLGIFALFRTFQTKNRARRLFLNHPVFNFFPNDVPASRPNVPAGPQNPEAAPGSSRFPLKNRNYIVRTESGDWR